MASFQIIQPQIDLKKPILFSLEDSYFNNTPKFDQYSYPTYDNLYENLISDIQPQDTSNNTQFQNLITAIEKHIGIPYSNSVAKGEHYRRDCSGFVNWVYKELGFDLKNATSVKMYNNLTDHLSFNEIQPGDLVFLTLKKRGAVAGETRPPGTPSHVGIVVEKQGTRIKVAESTGYKHKSDYTWYELGGPDKPSGNNVVNYSKGNKGRNRNELLGFGRLKSNYKDFL